MGIGGVVAGAKEGTTARLYAFAEELGHAFQLLDDLLDGDPTTVRIGKDVGKDAGKSTIVSIIGPTSVRRRIERHVENAAASVTEIFGPTSRLHGLIETIFDPTMRAMPEDERHSYEVGQELGVR